MRQCCGRNHTTDTLAHCCGVILQGGVGRPGNTLAALAGLGDVAEWATECLKAVEVVRRAPGSPAAQRSSYQAQQCAATAMHYFMLAHPEYWEA